MAQRCRLTVRAQMHGAVREPGYEFILPTGKLGPHRTSRIGYDRINNALGEHAHVTVDRGKDEPLYQVIEEIPDPPGEPVAAPAEPSLDEKVAAKRAELDALGERTAALVREIKELQAKFGYLRTSSGSPGVEAVPPMVPALQAAEKEEAKGFNADVDAARIRREIEAAAVKDLRPSSHGPVQAAPPRASLPLMSSPTTPPKERGGSDQMDGSF